MEEIVRDELDCELRVERVHQQQDQLRFLSFFERKFTIHLVGG